MGAVEEQLPGSGHRAHAGAGARAARAARAGSPAARRTRAPPAASSRPPTSSSPSRSASHAKRPSARRASADSRRPAPTRRPWARCRRGCATLDARERQMSLEVATGARRGQRRPRARARPDRRARVAARRTAGEPRACAGRGRRRGARLRGAAACRPGCPTWRRTRSAPPSDSAAALFGIARESLCGRSIAELLPGERARRRPGGRGRGEPRRARSAAARARAASPLGVLRRPGLLAHLGARRHGERARPRGDTRRRRCARSRWSSRRSPTCLADAEGRLQQANAAFRALVGLDAAGARRCEPAAVRGRDGGRGDRAQRRHRWRAARCARVPLAARGRHVVRVEVSSAAIDGATGVRVVAVRDLSRASSRRCSAPARAAAARPHCST